MSQVACLVFAALVLAGCPRKSSDQPAEKSSEAATPEACQRGCEHAAVLYQNAATLNAQMQIHELEESLEKAEQEAATNLVRLRGELAEPRPKFDAEVQYGRRKLSAAARRQIRSTWDLEGLQLQKQREAAIKAEEEGLAKTRLEVATLKKNAAEAARKAHGDGLKLCTDDCVPKQRSLIYVECLLQAITDTDVALCGGPRPPPDMR